jgi:hypothetical protein
MLWCLSSLRLLNLKNHTYSIAHFFYILKIIVSIYPYILDEYGLRYLSDHLFALIDYDGYGEMNCILNYCNWHKIMNLKKNRTFPIRN